MYVDIQRKLVFFDGFDLGLGRPVLTRYSPDSGLLRPVEGARLDDIVCDVSRDGHRLALRSVNWVEIRGIERSRLSFLEDAASIYETTKLLSFWSHFDPSGRYALVSTLEHSRPDRPVIIDLEAGEIGGRLAFDLEARSGDLDPVDGKLWAPDARQRNSMLSADCRTGEVHKIKIAIGEKVARLRFAPDGASVLVLGENDTIACCDRKGVTIWSRNLTEYGTHHTGGLYFNESGSHVCLSRGSSKSSEWGEDFIINVNSGHVEKTRPRFRGAPARIMSDWFGDRLLTYTGEIIEFFTGAIIDKLDLQVRATVKDPLANLWPVAR